MLQGTPLVYGGPFYGGILPPNMFHCPPPVMTQPILTKKEEAGQVDHAQVQVGSLLPPVFCWRLCKSADPCQASRHQLARMFCKSLKKRSQLEVGRHKASKSLLQPRNPGRLQQVLTQGPVRPLQQLLALSGCSHQPAVRTGRYYQACGGPKPCLLQPLTFLRLPPKTPHRCSH